MIDWITFAVMAVLGLAVLAAGLFLMRVSVGALRRAYRGVEIFGRGTAKKGDDVVNLAMAYMSVVALLMCSLFVLACGAGLILWPILGPK